MVFACPSIVCKTLLLYLFRRGENVPRCRIAEEIINLLEGTSRSFRIHENDKGDYEYIEAKEE
jgi:hypothetical protein